MILDLDPAQELPQENDVVRFSNGSFFWRVQKVLPYTNTLYVESAGDTGKRFGVQSVTNVITIQRDTKFRPQEDNTVYYYTEDADEVFKN